MRSSNDSRTVAIACLIVCLFVVVVVLGEFVHAGESKGLFAAS